MKYLFHVILSLGFAAAEAADADYPATFPNVLLTTARFVTWPAGALAPDSFVLCYRSDDPDAPSLQGLAGMRVQGRAVRLLALNAPSDALTCQILYLSARSDRARYLEAVAMRPVLTIGADAAILDDGAHLALLRAAPLIRTAVNVPALQRSGLRMDARLLLIARPRSGAAARQ